MIEELQRYAGFDPAFSHDSSALAIVEADTNLVRLVCLEEWRGSSTDRRDPRIIVPEAGALCRKYQADNVMSDVHYVAYVQHELEDDDIGHVDAPTSAEDIFQTYLKLMMLLRCGQLRLNCAVTTAKARQLLPRLKQQMARAKRVVQRGGGEKVELASSDGSHSDLLAALVLAVWQAPVVAQNGTFLRLRSRTAGHDHRYSGDGEKFYENSQDFEEADDAAEAQHEPLIATG